MTNYIIEKDTETFVMLMSHCSRYVLFIRPYEVTKYDYFDEIRLSLEDAQVCLEVAKNKGWIM